MSETKTSKDGAWVRFDEMTWPLPGSRLDEVEHRLRCGGATRADLLLAASVMAAYRQMVEDTAKQRAHVVRTLRSAIQDKGAAETPAHRFNPNTSCHVCARPKTKGGECSGCSRTPARCVCCPKDGE